MRLKAGFVIGFGVGYVLGAKAGRERYQQIVEATQAFLDNPGVQRLTDEVNKTVSIGRERVTSAASRRVEQVSGTLAEQASKARSFVGGGGEGSDAAAGDKDSTDAGTAKKAERKKADDTAGAPSATTTSSTTSSTTSTTRSGRSS